MTPSLSTRDLIELSLLDAMGLLDDEERAEFERAFAGTSPAIQAHIRREQTRLAQIDFLLPEVEPPADLRSAVLEAVRRAMTEGSRAEPAKAAFIPAMLPSRRVSPLWRAGAVGFATAAVVFGFFTVKMKNDFDYLEAMTRTNFITDQAMVGLGGAFEDAIFNPNIRHVVFSATSDGVRGKAVLLLDDENGEAFLMCRNLPAEEGREYRLVVIDAEGKVGELLDSFTSNGFSSQPVNVRLASHQRVGIVPPGEQTPILITGPIGT
jgi:hypothetical protein